MEISPMPDFASALGASKSASTLLVLFIPSKDRSDQAIDQAYWVEQALTVLGTLFGGATAFPQGKGVWRDDARGGKLLFDEPVVIQCYTGEQILERQSPALRDFLYRMGREARQGAVGFVIDRDYLEIGFPLKESPGTKRRNGGKPSWPRTFAASPVASAPKSSAAYRMLEAAPSVPPVSPRSSRLYAAGSCPDRAA